MTQAEKQGEKKYDLIIAGGGMVGLSLALTLASHPNCAALKILLVDSSPFIKKPVEGEANSLNYHPSFDARASALSLSSIEHYSALGFVDEILAHAEAIQSIHVSDKGHIGSTLLDNQAESLDAFGYVVENHWLGKVLLKQTARFANIEIASAASVVTVTPKSAGVQVKIANQDPNLTTQDQAYFASANLLVIAEGSNSALRKKIGITASQTSYEQSAIVANVRTQQPHQGRAFERFTASGAVALLPLPESSGIKNRSALVWTLPCDEASAICNASEPVFIAALQAAFGDRLGVIQEVGAKHIYPLTLEVANEEYRSNIVLMGNAAHALHPIAGQGFNLSLRDVAALTNCLAEACVAKNNIGALPVLEQYGQRQAQDQSMTIGFSHALTQLYRNNTLPIQAGRNLGLLLLDTLSLPKNEFVRQATGIAGRKNV